MRVLAKEAMKKARTELLLLFSYSAVLLSDSSLLGNEDRAERAILQQ
jgi:hypothetical protein